MSYVIPHQTNRAGSFEPIVLGKILWLLRDMTVKRILWQNQVVKNEILGQKLVDVIGKIPKVHVNIGRSAHFIITSASVSTLSTFCIIAFQCCFPQWEDSFWGKRHSWNTQKKVSVSLTKIYFKTQIKSLKFDASVNANVPMLKFFIAILTKLNFRCKWRRE